MTKCTYLDKKEWMRWYVTQSALLDERNMHMLEKFYNAGPSTIKACTSRGPGGIQTSHGTIDYISPEFVYPKICYKLGHPVRPDSKTSAGYPSSVSLNSDVPASFQDNRPPYRKRTKYGVYVGEQPSHVVKVAAQPIPWNPDTTIPRGCNINRCKNLHGNKGSKKP